MIKEVAAVPGFTNPANPGKAFKRWFGVSPGMFRLGGLAPVRAARSRPGARDGCPKEKAVNWFERGVRSPNFPIFPAPLDPPAHGWIPHLPNLGKSSPELLVPLVSGLALVDNTLPFCET